MVYHPAEGDGVNVAAKSEGLGPTSCSKNWITSIKISSRERWTGLYSPLPPPFGPQCFITAQFYILCCSCQLVINKDAVYT